MPPRPRTPRSRILCAAAAAGAVIALPACGAFGGAADDDADAAPSAAASSASPSPSEPAPEPFTIAFGGDVHFEGMLRQRLDEDPETAIGPVAEVLSEADLAVVNLETAITEGGTPADKEFVFRAPATALDALAAGGVDVASVANNHGMDYGVDGLYDTLAAAEDRGFPLIGIGEDADAAYAPHIAEVNGNTVAVIGVTQVMDDQYIPTWTATDTQPGMASAKPDYGLGGDERTLEAVRAAAEEADAVVVYLHWGLEGDNCPMQVQTDFAARLAEAGADVIVGGHAHRVNAGGYLGDAYVHYGLGNFVFYHGVGDGAETGVLRLTMQGDRVLDDEWLPGTVTGGIPVLAEDEAQISAALDRQAERLACTNLAAAPAGGSAGPSPSEATAAPVGTSAEPSAPAG